MEMMKEGDLFLLDGWLKNSLHSTTWKIWIKLLFPTIIFLPQFSFILNFTATSLSLSFSFSLSLSLPLSISPYLSLSLPTSLSLSFSPVPTARLSALMFSLFVFPSHSEPTSGLDSGTSISLMNSLHSLAALGVNVVATLHQPRNEIFNLIDSLILLAPGGMWSHSHGSKFLCSNHDLFLAIYRTNW